MDREGPGLGADFLCRSSRFLNSNSCSNFSRPGLKDLTKGGVDCLGGVLGGNFLLLGGILIIEHLIWRWGNCWCPPGSTFGNEDPLVGSSSHLFPLSATRPPPLRN